MINPENFFEYLTKNQIEFFCGVPDSLLKEICACISDKTDSSQHIITPNEGNAVALASGYNLATGKTALVYMQNSGLGNSVNPLVSLADKEVYSVPILLLIGWRGEPGVKDEPQHIKQGKITLDLLNTLQIKYEVLSSSEEEVYSQLDKAINYINNNSEPYALVARKDLFEKYTSSGKDQKEVTELEREDVIEYIINNTDSNDIVVSTTGKASRELYELRNKYNSSHQSDFLTVGSMGHASSIALAIALKNKSRKIICVDGDGSVIMHMGALSMIGNSDSINFKHIVLNNGAHESVGGQPTAGFKIDICTIAKGCGYKYAESVKTLEDLKALFHDFMNSKGPSLFEIKVNLKSRSDLGRPKTSPLENKFEFVEFIR